MASVFLKEVWRGKSLSRCLVNQRLAEKKILLSGRLLDLGAGFGKASYRRFLNLADNAKIIKLDIENSTSPDKQINFENTPLPFADNSVDNLLAFNLFEHIFNFQFLAKEAGRVLKPAGRLLGSSPFFIRKHPDPYDYFRYTDQALEKIFREAGFKQIQVEAIGRGPFLACLYQLDFIFNHRFILCRAFRFLLVYFTLVLDKLLLYLKPGLKDRYPLDYLFFLQK